MMTKTFAILAPCFNEGVVIKKFLDELNEVLSICEYNFTVVIADDHSNKNTINILKDYEFDSKKLNLEVIRLKYNMGHQEAIRQGLLYINKKEQEFNGTIVMDSDGEDDPQSILKAIELSDFNIVFFERGKRREAFIFRVGYKIYQLIFKIATGKTISVGNFSMLSNEVLESIQRQKFFHYASFLSKQKFSIHKIKSDRRKRIDGKSKMSYNGLVIHGLKSLIEFSEELLIFFIKILIAIILFSISFGLVVVYKKFISNEAILGWASTVGILLINLILIVATFLISIMMSLSIKNIISRENNNSYEKIK